MSRWERRSKPAKIAVLAVLLTTIGLTVAAVVVYSDSTDGQMPVLWVAIVIYGLLCQPRHQTRGRWRPADPAVANLTSSLR